jgi:hypothetical protein
MRVDEVPDLLLELVAADERVMRIDAASRNASTSANAGAAAPVQRFPAARWRTAIADGTLL